MFLIRAASSSTRRGLVIESPRLVKISPSFVYNSRFIHSSRLLSFADPSPPPPSRMTLDFTNLTPSSSTTTIAASSSSQSSSNKKSPSYSGGRISTSASSSSSTRGSRGGTSPGRVSNSSSRGKALLSRGNFAKDNMDSHDDNNDISTPPSSPPRSSGGKIPNKRRLISASKNSSSSHKRGHVKPRTATHVVLPSSELGSINLKTLGDLSKQGFRTLMYQLARMSGEELKIDPVLLQKIRTKRNTNRGSMNLLAKTIDVPIDTAELLLLELGCTVSFGKSENKDRVRSEPSETTPRRTPIVVVMGHVDHGKTTLLDSLRNTQIADKEHGGITQSIAGFLVDYKPTKSTVCFLDTPGHEAFALMRKSGAAVTDVAVVVIAATDGVRPQTIESIEYARKGKIPIVFAITKTDMMGGNFDENTVIDGLHVHGLYDEANDLFVKVVAPKREGLDELMDTIQLVVESDPLRARSEIKDLGEAVVLESRLDRVLGMIVDVVLRWGTFKVGDAIVCEEQCGKIKRIIDVHGKTIPKAIAGMPVRLCMGGFTALANPGMDVLGVKDEKTGKSVVEYRAELHKLRDEAETRTRILLGSSNKPNRGPHVGEFKFRKTRKEKRVLRKEQDVQFEELNKSEEARRRAEFRCVLKTDTEGSLHALTFAMNQLKDKDMIPEGHELVVVRKSVGHLTSQDVDFAKNAQAVILGFNLKVPSAIAKEAKTEDVTVLNHPVIYHLIEEYVSLLVELKEKQEEDNDKDVVEGTCTVLKVFQLTGKEKKQVAGCKVISGTLNKARMFVVKRDGEPVCEYKLIESLKILKESVALVEKGTECGVALKGFAAFQEGDIIECIRVAKK